LILLALASAAFAQVGAPPRQVEWKETSRLQLSHENQLWDYTREQLEIQGIPVWGQEVIKIRGAGLPEERFLSATKSREDARPARNFSLVEIQAIQAAKDHLEWPNARAGLVDRWWMADDQGQLQPVWRVIIERNISELRRIMVDGVDGRIVEEVELTNRQQAQRGLAIPSNPLFSGVQVVDLPRLAGAQTLTGPNIKVSSWYPVFLGAAPFSALGTIQTQIARANAQGNFFFEPGDPRFSETQVYFGAARAAEYIRSLGFQGLNRQFDAVAWFFDDENPYDVNAFFTPTPFNGSGGIFLQVNALGADTAFDSDIIFHEYGHAVVHAMVNSLNSSQVFRSVNEAFADYFAASFFDSPEIGEYFPFLSPSPNVLVSEPFLRNINNSTVYPDDVRGQEHADSLMFSSALWDIRQAFGRARGDAIAINGLARMSATGGFFSSASALVAAARALYGNITAGVVEGILRDRGLLSDAARFQEDSIPIASGAVRTGFIPTNPAGRILLGAEDYRIRIPTRSRSLRIEVEANPTTANIVAYLRFRAPVEIRDGQIIADYVFTGTSPNLGVINQLINFESTPELQMGDYYLVVGNRSGGPLNYAVRMTIEADLPGANSFFPAINNGQTVRGVVPRNFLNSRQFRLEVPAGTTGVEIVLEGQRDVDLYINYGNPVRPGGEGLPLAEGVSASASNVERMVLTTGTIPNLRPGTYFLAVENFDRAGSSSFTLRVNFRSEAVFAPSPEVVNPGDSRSLLLPASFNTAFLLPRQFQINTQQGWTGLQLEATTNAAVVMLVRRAQPVTFRNGIPQFDAATIIVRGTERITFNAQSNPQYQQTVYYVAFLSVAEQGGTLSFRFNPLPLAAGGGPRVAAVVDGAGFLGRISPGSWVTITGENLSRTTRIWAAQDFIGGNRLPLAIDGVSVTIGGQQAWVYYVSPTQLNILVPQDLRIGNLEVVVTLDSVRSAAFNVIVVPETPSLFRFDPIGRRYAAAVLPNGTFSGPGGLFGNAVLTVPVRRGQIVQLFATGLGNVNTQDGVTAEPVVDMTNRVIVTVGGIRARVAFAGRVGPGLYQINVEAPANAPIGENQVRVSINNAISPEGVFIVVQE
jgi:uncharacterized protein (TIGR03437 family)